MKQSPFPSDWDQACVENVLTHYEAQSEDEALTEDEAAFNADDQTVMDIPNDLVPAVRELIARHNAA